MRVCCFGFHTSGILTLRCQTTTLRGKYSPGGQILRVVGTGHRWSAGDGKMGENGGGDDLAYSRSVGERIRTIRRQKRLSLQDVEARSESEFKASVLGAYERGERAISLPRMHRLARFYNVPVDQMLPGGSDPVDPTRVPVSGKGLLDRKVVIDLTRLADCTAPESALIDRYLTLIQVKRQDFNGRVLTIRRDDLQALAAILGTGIEEALPRLEELDLIRRSNTD